MSETSDSMKSLDIESISKRYVVSKGGMTNFCLPETSELPEGSFSDPTTDFQGCKVAYNLEETKTALGVPVGTTFPLDFKSDKSTSFQSLICETDDGLSSDYSRLDKENQTYLSFRSIPGTDSDSDGKIKSNKVDLTKTYQKSLDSENSSNQNSDITKFQRSNTNTNKTENPYSSLKPDSAVASCSRQNTSDQSGTSKEQNWQDIPPFQRKLQTRTVPHSVANEDSVSEENLELQTLRQPIITKSSIYSENKPLQDLKRTVQSKLPSEDFSEGHPYKQVTVPQEINDVARNKFIQAKENQIDSMKLLLDKQRQSYIRRLQREVQWLQKVEKLLLEAQQNRFETSFSTASDTDGVTSKDHFPASRAKTKTRFSVRSILLSNRNSNMNSTSRSAACQLHSYPSFMTKNKDYGKWSSSLQQASEHKLSEETSSLEQYPLFYLNKGKSESEVSRNLSDTNSTKSGLLSGHEKEFVKSGPSRSYSGLINESSDLNIAKSVTKTSERKSESSDKPNKSLGNVSKGSGNVNFINILQDVNTNEENPEGNGIQSSDVEISRMTAGTDTCFCNAVDQIYQRCQICKNNLVTSHSDFLKKQDFNSSHKFKTNAINTKKSKTVCHKNPKEEKISVATESDPSENGNMIVKYRVHSMHNKENESTVKDKEKYSVGIQTSPLLDHLEQLERKFTRRTFQRREDNGNQISSGTSERFFVSLPITQKTQIDPSLKKAAQNKKQPKHYRKIISDSHTNQGDCSNHPSKELFYVREHEVTQPKQSNQYSAEVKNVSWFVPLSDECLPWFQPRGKADGENDGSKEPTMLHVCKVGSNQAAEENEDSPTDQQFNLQEAFHYFKSSFILKSKARQQKVKISARKRNIGVQTQADIPTRIRNAMTKSHPIFDQLHKPSKRVFTHQEMRLQTERKFRRLPENISEVDKKQTKETYKTNRLMAQMFTKKIQKRTLKGQVSYMITDKCL